MDTIQVEDTLEPLGIAAGALLVLMALGTIVGMPWATANGAVVALLQVVGVFVTAAIGVALVWLSYVDE